MPVTDVARKALTDRLYGGASMGSDILLVAACALIDADGRVLLAKRPRGRPLEGLWEFPGGKVEAGETPEAALVRELDEELGITVAEKCLAPLTFASHSYEAFHLLMPLYACRKWDGEVAAKQGQELAWVRANRLADYAMPPADEPLKAMLRDLL
jgi:8-oxo-dGTP diphosphatase